MNVLFAPSNHWIPEQKSFLPGTGPDPLLLYRCLADQGIDATFMDPHFFPWNPLAGKGTVLESIDPLRAMRIAVQHRDVDVVVSVFEGAAASLRPIKTLMRLDAAVVQWDIGLTDWSLRNKIINFALPGLDELLVLGQNQIDYIKSKYSACSAISAIGHYVDANFYKPSPLNMSGNIISVGDDVGRDFKTLLEATEGLNKKLIIKASKNAPQKLHANATVIKERISYGDLKSLYDASSVVVVPTHATQNACGVSTILEAAACGRPLIVTDNPGIHDFLIPDETCLVVPKENPTAMRFAIERLLSEPATCMRLASNARALVEEKFTTEVFSKRFGTALRRISKNKVN